MKKCSLPQTHLNPGEIILCSDARMVVTVLGSCVSVTLFDPVLSLAGICHAMLPDPGTHHKQNAPENKYRYVSFAVPELCQRFLNHGIPASRIEVKLFGGSNIINPAEENQLPRSRFIGSANVKKSEEILKQFGLHIRASNVGGVDGRKILFNTSTGEVMHKFLNSRIHRKAA